MILTDDITPAYCGRFSPSPTGPLHLGSLVAALGSYLQARTQAGRWLVRMEDVDQPRCRPQFADDILRTLEALGFAWDGEVMVQSRRTAAYRAALDRLVSEGWAFGCACTRKELADSARASDGGQVYPGTCRHGLVPGREARAWRIRCPDREVCFNDAVQGSISRNLAMDCGDFVLLRADGYFSYQLAVVIDDAEQGITQVVRGADLIESTPRQIHLQQVLGFPTPSYAHLPLVLSPAGEKLSKQTKAVPVDPAQGVAALHFALRFLGQHPPAELCKAGLGEVWQWAQENWRVGDVPRRVGMEPDSYSR